MKQVLERPTFDNTFDFFFFSGKQFDRQTFVFRETATASLEQTRQDRNLDSWGPHDFSSCRKKGWRRSYHIGSGQQQDDGNGNDDNDDHGDDEDDDDEHDRIFCFTSTSWNATNNKTDRSFTSTIIFFCFISFIFVSVSHLFSFFSFFLLHLLHFPLMFLYFFFVSIQTSSFSLLSSFSLDVVHFFKPCFILPCFFVWSFFPIFSLSTLLS